MSEQEEVVRANAEFYRAFSSLDVENMEKIWLKDRQIVCIHPGWRKLSGWGPVMHSWERIFENVFEMRFDLGDIDVVMSGDIAVVVVEENLTQHGYDGVTRTQVLSTNVFERVGVQWFLVMHHGSPVVMPPETEEQLQ
jgi:ketosteroid isomerase-like protein